VRVTSGGSLWVFDHEGRVVLSTDPGSEQEDAGALFAAARGRDGRLVRADLRGVPSATVSVPLTVAGSRAPWTVVASTSERAIARKAEPWRHAAAVAGLAVVVILGAAVISAGITRPIATLEEGTRRIAQGDLEFQVPVSGQNELARLAASFHQMAYALKRAEERLTKSERLAAIGEESLAIHREVNAPLASLIEAAASLKAQPDLPAEVREQVAPLYEQAVRMRELLLNLEHVHHHARDAEPVREIASVPAPDRQAGGAA
jgi:HAMP domain-containing protein